MLFFNEVKFLIRCLSFANKFEDINILRFANINSIILNIKIIFLINHDNKNPLIIQNL